MNESFDLLTTVESGGCSAKLPAGELEILLKDIPVLKSDKLLVGTETHDDASVWKLSSETAIISTTDFFPPVCSDPYDFGQIAAANSLSDIYAMGGQAITALNLVMFPSDRIDISVLRDILKGGADKCIEAEAVLAGGHTIDDFPPKYGLAVTGIVHPDRIITNSNAKSGDVLILTKALGTGTIIAGKRIGEAQDDDYMGALESMKQLNKEASRIMQKYSVKTATDITGFSLLGHSMKMARASGVMLSFDSKKLPILPGAYDLIEEGCIPGASFRNLKFTDPFTGFSEKLDYNLKMVAADAQTSGGILMCVPDEKADAILAELLNIYPFSCVVGKVKEYSAKGPSVLLR